MFSCQDAGKTQLKSQWLGETWTISDMCVCVCVSVEIDEYCDVGKMHDPPSTQEVAWILGYSWRCALQ